MTYLPRLVDDELKRRLNASGAVVIEGPKACGKTQTARQQAASEVLLDIDSNAQQAIDVEPSLVLEGERPRLIDEWQIRPEIWNHVRRRVDEENAAGLFILTGSATPADDETRHTGAGRFSRLRMRPMSLTESQVSTREVSVGGLLEAKPTACPAPDLDLDGLIDAVIRGGWPGFRDLGLDDARRAVIDYLDQIRRTDINAVGAGNHDPERVLRVLQSVARNTATRASLTSLARDASGSDLRIADDTVSAYLNALTRLMIIEDQPAWQPHLRSSHRLRTTPARHFVDPSLAAAAMRATPASLKADLNTFGLLFESLVVRDLRIYGQVHDATVAHYRDHGDLEVDAVLSAADGRWIGLEIKLGASPAVIDQAAVNLTTFAGRVDVHRTGAPAALGVVTGSGFGYVRPDGVHVIPIGALTA
jgi:predicted AAA+ superfamily ATPase